LQNAYQGNAANVASLSSALNSQLPTITTNALNNPNVNAASSYYGDVLSSKYLDSGNPYLSSMISQTNDDVSNRVMGSLGSFGRFGGDAQSQILGRELAKNESSLRYGDYSAERDRMGQAASGAGALAGVQNQGLGTYLAALQEAADLPTSNASSYAQSMAGLMGNYTTTTQKNSVFNNLLALANAGSSAYKAFSGGGG